MSPASPTAAAPDVAYAPEYVSSSAQEAADLSALAGFPLFDWQVDTLELMLAERADRQWACRDFGLAVPRQNGKGEVLQARELFGLFVLGERLVIHSAHLFATSLEAFRRMREAIEGTPELSRRLKSDGKSTGIRTANGDESIELAAGPSPDGIGRVPGARLQYKARTKGGAGRGLTGDLVVLDEAMYLPESVIGSLRPVVSARPNPQIVFAGSAVDQTEHEDGRAFARIRARGRTGKDPSLGWVEYAAGDDLTKAHKVADDPAAWARANPSLHVLINQEAVEAERLGMDLRTFAVERLGIGDWPELDQSDDASQRKLDPAAWDALTDETSNAKDPVVFSFDVKPDRGSACVGVAGRRPDGLLHVEVVEQRPGTQWVPERVRDLVRSHRTADEVVCAARSPAASLVPALLNLGVKVRLVPAGEHAEACGALYDDVDNGQLRHLGTDELAQAVRGARTRALGDAAWLWSRSSSKVDISPLVAITLAAGALRQRRTGKRIVARVI